MDAEERYMKEMNAIVDLYQDDEISIFDTVKRLTVLKNEIETLRAKDLLGDLLSRLKTVERTKWFC